jgi:hypothetical protein
LYPLYVHVSGLDEPTHVAVTTVPESTLKVSPPDGATPLPVYATVAEKFGGAVPAPMLTALTVTVGVCAFTVSVVVPVPLA